MLRCLSGRRHHVYTAFCLAGVLASPRRLRIVDTEVEFADLSQQEIDNYIRTGEPMDKAGAYAVQGIGGVFVRSLSGSYSNVVGLPLAELAEELKACGFGNSFPRSTSDER
jgi:septum formation protein